MIISPASLLTPFYSGEFDDFLGNTWKVELLKTNVSELPIESDMDFTGTPLVIKQFAGNIESPIHTKEFVVNLNVFNNFRFLNLMRNNKNMDFVIRIFKDTVLTYQGYLVPDVYNEQFMPVPYPTSLVFSDGLPLLKNIPFSETKMAGLQPLRKVFAYILSKLKLDVRLQDEINIRDERWESITGQPFNTSLQQSFLWQHKVNTLAFYEDTCYEVLEKLLKSIFSKIEMVDNRWTITRVDQVYTYRARKISRVGDYDGEPLMINPVISLTGASAENRVVFTDHLQEVETLPGWKHYELVHNLTPRPSMADVWDFKAGDFDGNNLKFARGNLPHRRTIHKQESVLELRTTYRRNDVLELDLGNYTYNGKDRVRLEIDAAPGTYRPELNDRATWWDREPPRQGLLRVIEDTPNRFICDRVDIGALFSRGINRIQFIGNHLWAFEVQSEIMNIKTWLHEIYDLQIYTGEWPFDTPAPAQIISFKMRNRTDLNLDLTGQDRDFDKDFRISIWPPQHNIQIFTEDKKLTQDRQWYPQNDTRNLYLPVELKTFNDSDFEDVSIESTHAPEDGEMVIRIGQIRPYETTVGALGSMFYNKIFATLTNVLEEQREKVLISDKFAVEGGDVDIYFGTAYCQYAGELALDITFPTTESYTLIIEFFKRGRREEFTFFSVGETQSQAAASLFNSFRNFGVGTGPFPAVQLLNWLDCECTEYQDVAGTGRYRFFFRDRSGDMPNIDRILLDSVPQTKLTAPLQWNTFAHKVHNRIEFDENTVLKYLNILYFWDNTISQKHIIFGQDESTEIPSDDIKNLVKYFYTSHYKQTRTVLQGNIETAENLFNKVIYSPDLDTHYRLVDVSWDVRKNTYDMRAYEVKNIAPSTPVELGDYSDDYSDDYNN